MRRREGANMVVLASGGGGGNYCDAKAAFEPVLEHLARLSSPKFYVAVESWLEIVCKGMEHESLFVAGICGF
ncbi:hypothetical protein JG687_00010907 [Phytophthora cactorum]|uniref:Uncharacterized protein n=1 Tax=Phytophthora cactorum TaxID=29920 RepID=A0A8T1U7T8_9STRA|nr:hypothetical protein JG687_00010907 [Phytophthora cactorum]